MIDTFKREKNSVKFTDWFPEHLLNIVKKNVNADNLSDMFYEIDENISDNESISVEFKYLQMNKLPPLVHKGGINEKVFIRPCYDSLFNILLTNINSISTANLLVTGNPGIGKS